MSYLKKHEPRQIAWQNWRNRLYQHLCDERRATASNARVSEYRVSSNTLYAESESGKTTTEVRLLDSLETFYSQVVSLDTSIKAAHAAQDLEQYTSALDEAETIMGQSAVK